MGFGLKTQGSRQKTRRQDEGILRSAAPRIAAEGKESQSDATVEPTYSVPVVDERLNEFLAQMRAHQMATSNRQSTSVQSVKRGGERKHLSKIKALNADYFAKQASAEADRARTAELFGEIASPEAGASPEELRSIAATEGGASVLGLEAARNRRALMDLPGSDARLDASMREGLSYQARLDSKAGLARTQDSRRWAGLPGAESALDASERAALRDEGRAAAESGLALAQDSKRWASLPSQEAAPSMNDLEDMTATYRRNAIQGQVQKSRGRAQPSMGGGVPVIEDVDQAQLGVGLRSAFRNESSPLGILKGARVGGAPGGVKWRDENPAEGRFAERTKTFGFTDPSSSIAGAQEFGADGHSVPDDTREHMYYPANKSAFTAGKSRNTRDRTAQLADMFTRMPASEYQDNAYAQDLGSSDALTYSKSRMSDAEAEEFDDSTMQARSVQNEALGVGSYDVEDRRRIVKSANSKPGKSGFFDKFIDALGLNKIFGSRRSDDRTFNAAPRRRTKPRSMFDRLFGTRANR